MPSSRPDLSATLRLLVGAAPAVLLAVVVGGRVLTQPGPPTLLGHGSAYAATRLSMSTGTASIVEAEFETAPPVPDAGVPRPSLVSAVSGPLEEQTPASTTTSSERAASVEPVPAGPDTAPVVPVVVLGTEPVVPVEKVEPVPAPPPSLPPPPATPAPPPLPATYAGSSASPAALAMGLEAVGLISYPWQQNLPGWRVEFHDSRVGYRGLTFPAERVIMIYVRQELGVWGTAEAIAHELGHAVDVDRMDDADRNAWLGQRGLGSDHVWYPDAYATDFASGAGDWAEAFAVWQLGSSSRSAAGQPSAADLALVARLAG